MADPTVYSIGEVVQHKDGIYVIEGITKITQGYNVYKLLNIDTHQCVNAFKHQLVKATQLALSLDDSFTNSENASADQLHLTEVPIPSNRFATLTEIDINNIADARTSKNTDVQTKWGLKIFKGR